MIRHGPAHPAHPGHLPSPAVRTTGGEGTALRRRFTPDSDAVTGAALAAAVLLGCVGVPVAVLAQEHDLPVSVPGSAPADEQWSEGER